MCAGNNGPAELARLTYEEHAALYNDAAYTIRPSPWPTASGHMHSFGRKTRQTPCFTCGYPLCETEGAWVVPIPHLPYRSGISGLYHKVVFVHDPCYAEVFA